jgi:hypothetical protein
MRAVILTIVAFSAASAAAFAGQLIYYAVSDGENDARKTWHTAVLSSFKAGHHDDVFDSYTVERQPNGGLVVTRDYTTPSGDWLVKLTYDYARNGRLHAVRSELITFGGITISGEDEGLTRCVRTFAVTARGTLQKTSERITDAKTGRKVARQFYDPQPKHWMNVGELPIVPKT